MRAALGVYTKCFASWPKVQEREGRGGGGRLLGLMVKASAPITAGLA